MERLSLTTVTCDDCGACCMHMGMPPGYAVFFSREPLSADVVRNLAGEDTVALWESMSDEARLDLIDQYSAIHAGRLADRVREEVPCLWLDPWTRRCRHYEHRPPVCREFRVGSAACHRHRAARGFPIPGAIPSAEEVREELIHDMAEGMNRLPPESMYTAEALKRMRTDANRE